MTHIAEFPTKKALREAIASGREVTLYDPSVHKPTTYVLNSNMAGVEPAVGTMIFVTNHPQRSWFANITKRADGSYKVN